MRQFILPYQIITVVKGTASTGSKLVPGKKITNIIYIIKKSDTVVFILSSNTLPVLYHMYSTVPVQQTLHILDR